jgi:hypothetical protein
MTRFANPVPKYTDASGNFMPYGLLYFYDSGTNSDKTTFADVNETIANTQPLLLNGDGSVPNCFYSGSAKVVLITNAGTAAAPINGTQQWERDPVTSDAVGAIGQAWDSQAIYNINSVAILDDIFYVSITNANQNNNPSTTATAWTRWDLLKRWNTNETYNLGDPVIMTDLTLYISQSASNLGNNPTSSPTKWLPSVVSADLVTFDDALLPFTATNAQDAITLAAPIAWGVFNFDTDTLVSGGGCTVVRNGVGTATIELDNAASAAINILVLTNQTSSSGVFFSTTQGFLNSNQNGDIALGGTITNGTTTKVITNPLGSGTLVKSDIQVTPNETLGSASYMYISAVTSTTFTVAVDVDPGKDVDFGYQVSMDNQGEDVTNFGFAVYDTGA